MSNNWDFYLCQIDGNPASIFVDLGLAQALPLDGHPHLAYIRVFMRSAQPNGLSSADESPMLIEIEDRLLPALTGDESTVFVGRTTSGGSRDFYFYAADADDWVQQVAAVMAAFPDYIYEAGARRDEAWETYLHFLHPTPEDMERIQNRRVCDSLESNGDALTQPREMDHWASFPSDVLRAQFVSRISAQGFGVRATGPSNDTRRPFGVQFFRVDTPSYEDIDEITLPLFRAAVELDGQYHGWETHVVNEAAQ
jgi:Family of unknown function (DUF695)/Regulator of ribonuclease activity B